jgi:hypothetical protein
MSKGPTGVENPLFHLALPTKDGRWMIAYSKDGDIVKLPDTYQSEEEANLVCGMLNKRESERYHNEILDTEKRQKRP